MPPSRRTIPFTRGATPQGPLHTDLYVVTTAGTIGLIALPNLLRSAATAAVSSQPLLGSVRWTFVITVARLRHENKLHYGKIGGGFMASS